MDHLHILHKARTGVVDELLQSPVSVSLKIDGTAFQVSVENGKVVYRKRSGNPMKPGPILDQFTLLYFMQYTDAIEHFERHKDALKHYKFLTFELYHNKIVILSGIDDTGTDMDHEALSGAAKDLRIDAVPEVHNGTLSDDQKALLRKCIYNADSIDDFTTAFYETFNVPNKVKEFIGTDTSLEGFVFTFNVGNKKVSYKVVNPDYTRGIIHKKTKAAELSKVHEDTRNEIVLDLIWVVKGIVNVKGYTKDPDYWTSLNNVFVTAFKTGGTNIMNNLMNRAAKLPVSPYAPDMRRLSPDIKRLYKRLGDPFRNLYEIYLMTFKKPRTRNHIIDYGTQETINELIAKI